VKKSLLVFHVRLNSVCIVNRMMAGEITLSGYIIIT